MTDRAEVALFNGLDKTLHYAVPEEIAERARPGCRVLVPLARGESTGMIVGAADESMPSDLRLRPIRAVLDPEPILPEELIALCRWVAHYYVYPLGEVIQTALPPGATGTPRQFFRLTESGRNAPPHTAAFLEQLRAVERMEAGVLLKDCAGGAKRTLQSLEHQGLIERIIEWHIPSVAPKRVKAVRLASGAEGSAAHPTAQAVLRHLADAGAPVALRALRAEFKNLPYWIAKLEAQGLVELTTIEEAPLITCAQTIPEAGPHTLTGEQQAVVTAVLARLTPSAFEPFLLFGVTGSGKTEVYLRLVEAALAQGRGALVLVPEIALSTQLDALFRQRFGALVVTWHSGLPASALHSQWRELLTGQRRVVLGVRSAVFLPVRSLGLIIVDEEHDLSYKQDDHLRYHARDVALMRAQRLNIPILLGSATPSLQSVHNCRTGRYTGLRLPGRILNRPQPELHFVDMRRQSGRSRVLSNELQRALVETLASGDQALLFLNRRGFATLLLCTVCGHVLQCAHCSVSLTFHQAEERLRCHFCGYEREVPERCPACEHAALHIHGFGTERVEEEVRRCCPQARLVRIDRDTVQSPQQIVDRLNAVRHRTADILIGTQMVAKGHDFPDITLVGIINADTALQIPDFRAGENTVQLLLQVAGRAGRGEKPGRVILQTYNPAHYTIQSVLDLDYEGFCTTELATRERLQYPPYTRFLKFLVTSPHEATTREGALALGVLCRELAAQFRAAGEPVAVLGPSAAPYTRLKKRFRWHLFLKAWSNRDLQRFAEVVLTRSKEQLALRRVQIAIDRDPMMTL